MEIKKLLENRAVKDNQDALNICFFSHSAELAGAERTLLELVTELIQDYRVNCTVVLPKDGPLKEKLERIGAATRIIDYSWWYDSEILTDEQVKKLCINSAKNLLYNLKQTLQRINPDIVFTNTMSIPWGAIAASFLRKPHVWFIHEFGEADHGLKTFLPSSKTLEVIENFSSAILVNSESVKKALFPGLKKNKIKTCYQHINIPKRYLSQENKEYFTKKNPTKLIISASTYEAKGQKDAILAVKELVRRGRDVELIIMGHDTSKYAESLKAIVRQEKLKKHVSFIGFRENPYPIMNQADIVLVCSRKEAFGRVAVEAMLLKKPVIATNRGGTLELIKGGFNGLLYEPGDFNQLADRIEYLIDKPNRARRLAKNGHRFAKQTFTKKNFGGKICRILLDLKHKAAAENYFSDLSLEGPTFLDAFLAAANNQDQKITALITELGSFLNARIIDLQSNLQERKSEIKERESQIKGKESQIKERESQIKERESQIKERESQISALKNILQQNKDNFEDILQQNKDNFEDILQDKEFQIQGLKFQIEQSILMQLASRYHKIMEKMLPPGSRRHNYYEILLISLRIIIKEGWPVFFRKARYRFTNRPAELMTSARNAVSIKAEQLPALPETKTSNQLIKDIPNPKEITSLKEIEGLVFKPAANPLVSIIMLTHNQWQYTYICLKSILEKTAKNNYEIILADNCSTDLTATMLKKVKGIKVIKNKENLGFVKGCNDAAAFVKGKYILFLNNDTYVTKNWLETLLEPAEKDGKVGIVGPNLISSGGKLQENGWIMNLDGWGRPIGRDENPDNYKYNYLREVDCVTGACLLIKKDIFFEVGRFDEIYAPGYYEEFDLAFAVKNKGYKVIVQPKAKIIHYNNVTFGPENRDKLSSRNQAKFFKKWRPFLEKCSGDKSKKKRTILIVDDKVPDYDKNAGSLTMYQYTVLFQNLGFKVIFLPDNLGRLEPYTTEMQQQGIEVIYGEFNFDAWLKDNGRHLDLVWLSRPDISIRYLEKLKTQTNAKILYYIHDLHYLREQRRALLEKNDALMKESKRLKNVEFRIFKDADVIMTLTAAEKDIISKKFPDKKIAIIPTQFYEDFSGTLGIGFEKRKNLIFLGGFGHLPNIDAVLWFVKEIFPQILSKLPDIKLFIIGSNPPRSVRNLATNNIIVTGYVKELTPYFKKARVFVAPLRYGAGLKAKVVTSMYYGVPIVLTTIANEGIDMIDGENALIADEAEEFTEKAVQLYINKGLWEQLSKNSLELVKNRFSSQVARQTILNIIRMPSSENLTAPKKSKTINSDKKGIICTEPFSSMLFFFNGEVYSCSCPNWPKYSIGNIKQSSIAQLWNNDTARWIRRKMYEGKWQEICTPECPTIIDYLRSNKLIKYKDLEKIDRLSPELIKEIKARKDYLQSPPTYFKPDISGACNLNCIMCSRKLHKDDAAMQKKLWADLKHYLPTAKEMHLTGHGEPFVRPDTRELLINCKSLIKFHIITNGLLLPKYWEKIKHRNFSSLLISVDAATKETYEKIRRGGRWEDLLKTLELVRQNRDKFGSIMLNMTVMRSNYQEIPRFIDLAESCGFTACFHRVYGMWGDENIFELNDTEALTELRNIIIKENSKKRSIDIFWWELLYHLNLLNL